MSTQEEPKQIYVGNLPFAFTDIQLADLGRQYSNGTGAAVEGATIIKRRVFNYRKRTIKSTESTEGSTESIPSEQEKVVDSKEGEKEGNIKDDAEPTYISKGFGFIALSPSTSPEQAEEIVNKMNGQEVDGRVLIVQVARPKVDYTLIERGEKDGLGAGESKGRRRGPRTTKKPTGQEGQTGTGEEGGEGGETRRRRRRRPVRKTAAGESQGQEQAGN